MSSQSGKDVIYIDIDDEITAIIDKVRGSGQRIVALVLPKRATVFQSIVNMKLLKRTADDAKKHLVLITSETGLLPLAGAVGVYVAKSLQSKPEVPHVPTSKHHAQDEEESVDMTDTDTQLDKARPIGEYAGATAASGTLDEDDDSAVEFDNEVAPAPGDKTSKNKPKLDKKLKIPDFNKFRIWIILGGVGLVALIFFWYLGFVVMPQAKVTVKTNSEAVDTNIDVTFDTAATEVKVDEGLIPATKQETQKTASQQVAATGQRDKGTKASGSVTIKNCGGSEISIPSGTAVSVNGLTFVTQKRLDLDDGQFFGSCKTSGDHIDTTPVIAQQAGDKYNIEAASGYAVAGYGSSVSGTGTAMTGGTSNIVKIVTQADIDKAKEQIAAQDTNAIKTELSQALTSQGLYVIDDSLTSADAGVTASANVGDEVENVTVTQKLTYSMLGAKQDDLKKLVTNEVNKEIDPQKQAILDHGLDKAVFKLQNQQDTKTLVTLSTTSIAGSDLDLSEIKKQIAGKKANDAKEIITEYPGVTDVEVRYSPFWVSSIPKKASKITLTVEKPAVKDAR
ncbi:MAG TPA: hypothetical protein VFM05_15080 [Candidatus Saccharimonadales bacterium]|nr:hypothetical protein [Candidatus Saccharimonadales bacterium]